MNAIVREEAIQQDATQASVAQFSPASPRETVVSDEIARRISEDYADDEQRSSPPERPMSRRQGDAARTLRLLLRGLATACIAIVAVLSAILAWDRYNAAPWTRDGSVRVQVANVAPQISGQIKELRVVDNQFVHKGDILYVIEPFDFEIALRAYRASLQQKIADRDVKDLQAERRQRLSDLAVSTEEKQTYQGNAVQAAAVVDTAQEQVKQAEINLRRTEVRSPVNGFVTNLLLRVGNYAVQGTSNISIVDTDSFWIDGYFEETKLARLCVGDRAEAKLMGYPAPIIGHVATVTRGVSVSNAAAATQGLPNVDPVYTWVRLAQRVPVRIAIDKVPSGVPLVSGLTATVTIRDGKDDESRTPLQRVRADLERSFAGLFGGDPARPGCIPNPS
ncbi:HlyD family secretion protein [Bradyrhizobium sp. RD5-C2]|uniref:efflux RND transporter periplasmic adaptor subunit n=1 Tax=Bradyrhizobium sp. RD5-C2 TaxID=244562 RepID=UPI001ED0384E|nr:HlyD family secretion protein [Bradyrhizobium sp. RD5-C2]GIQ78282.1 multidrug transporter [Bradyrhizobium sp. RD5-C2]